MLRTEMTAREKLIKLRKSRGFTQGEFANLLGVSRAYISQIENGTRPPSFNLLKKVSQVFRIPIEQLITEDELTITSVYTPREFIIERLKTLPDSKIEVIEKLILEFTDTKLIKLPLLGNVVAGEPFEIDTTSKPIDWIEVPDIEPKGDFIVRVRGDSMSELGVKDGDLLVLSDKYSVESGELAVVVIDDKATFKRVHFKDSKIVLEPANSKYKEKEIEVDKHNIKIYKVCHIWRDLKNE